MTITTLPVLDRSSATFRTDVDTFFGAQLPAFGTEINALQTDVTAKQVTASAAAVTAASAASASAIDASAAAASALTALNAPGTQATSTTSNAIPTALPSIKSFAIQTGKSIAVGMTLKITSTTSTSVWMIGDVTAYDSGTGALIVNATYAQGSGTFAAWALSLAAPVMTTTTNSVRTMSTNYTMGLADKGSVIFATGSFALAYVAAATLRDGWYCYVSKDGAGTVTHNPDGAETIDGAATLPQIGGQVFLIVCDGTKLLTMPIAGAAETSTITVHTSDGRGSTATAIRRYTTVLTNVGTAITHTYNASLGSTFTINEAGIYAIQVQDVPGAGGQVGISVNSAALTTAVNSIPVATRLAYAMNTHASAAAFVCVTRTVRLAVGDVIRSHQDAIAIGSGSDNASFSITKVSA